MSLDYYEKCFSDLRTYVRPDKSKSPHKVALLLAVIDLYEKGKIQNNKILFNPALRNAFTQHFNELATPRDQDRPNYAFFYLRNESEEFWHHQIKPGKAADYKELKTPSINTINEYIAYAYLDDELDEYLRLSTPRNLLRNALLENLLPAHQQKLLKAFANDVSLVQSYFQMLEDHLAGLACNPADYFKTGGINKKCCSISTVLVSMGQPYIVRYEPKPSIDCPEQLKGAVFAHLAENPKILNKFIKAAGATVKPARQKPAWKNVWVNPPPKMPYVQEPERKYLAKKTNFSEQEYHNLRLGKAGEEFALGYEKYRLTQAGYKDLANEVEWSSQERGDGLGYDIRSFNPKSNKTKQDEQLYIEVKTTCSGKGQPFYLSANELAYSKEYSSQYCLYRVFNFKKERQLFQLDGNIERHVNLIPKSYLAQFGKTRTD